MGKERDIMKSLLSQTTTRNSGICGSFIENKKTGSRMTGGTCAKRGIIGESLGKSSFLGIRHL